MSSDLVKSAPGADLPIPRAWRMKARVERYYDGEEKIWFTVWEGRDHIVSFGEIDLAVFSIMEMARERAAEADMPYSPKWCSAADFALVANEFKGPEDRPVSTGYVSLSLLSHRERGQWVQKDTRGVKVAVWRLTKRGFWALNQMRKQRTAIETKRGLGESP